MALFLVSIVALGLLGLLITVLITNRDLASRIASADKEAAGAKDHFSAEENRVRKQAATSLAEAQKLVTQQIADLEEQSKRIRQFYEAEARKSQQALTESLAKALKDLEPLRKFEAVGNADTEAKRILSEAISEATALKGEAANLLDQARTAAQDLRGLANQRAEGIQEQADAMLNQAIKDAGRIRADADRNAQRIAGEAYDALRNKQTLEDAAMAIRNIIEGYGDRYLIPTHALIDDLAIEFGSEAAGQALRSTREQSRRMVEQGEAAACDYADGSRRETAIRFVIDAFNGRVDAILSRSHRDNFGKLSQEIQDAYSLVNFGGAAFRNARILPAYRDARLAELKWAVAVHELLRRQREEQRYLREQLRDEQKALEERRQKMREAELDEQNRKRALEEAEKRLALVHAGDRQQLEQEIERLRKERDEAAQRKLQISQKTTEGHVYIISNIGSFGNDVYKIGQTLRDPAIRVDELGGASVPFEFDVHGLIKSKNARALEHKLHKRFLAKQVNKINSRKEFFKVTLADILAEINKLKSEGEELTVREWTEKIVAQDYLDTVDIESDPEKRRSWISRQETISARQLSLDLQRLSLARESISSLPNQSESGTDVLGEGDIR